MRGHLWTGLLLTCSLAAACLGSKSEPGGGAGGTPGLAGASGAGGGAGVVGPSGSGGATGIADASGVDAKTGMSRGCDQDLTGTWDLLATSTSQSVSSGTLSISAEGLTIAIKHTRLVYAAAPVKGVTWTGEYGTTQVSVTNTATALDTGSIPLAAGGAWTFTGGDETCNVSIADGSVVGRCTGEAANSDVGGYYWPLCLGEAKLGVTYSASRSSTAPSQFGVFGGQWTGHASDSSGSPCTMHVEGNAVDLVCNTQSALKGNAHLVVGSDCVISGTTSTGYELSARKVQ